MNRAFHVLSFLFVLCLLTPATAAYWEPANSGMEAFTFFDIVIRPDNPQVVFICGPGGIYKSVNGGGTWTDSGQGLLPGPYVQDLAIDPSTPDTMYCVAQLPTGGRGVWKSVNAGAAWSPSSSGIHLPYINSLDIYRSDPQVLFAGTNVGGASGGVFRSTDAGASWTYIAGDQKAGSGMGNDAAPIRVDPFDSNYVFCGKNSYDGFARSTDGGFHWNWVDYSFVIKHLWIDPLDTSRILAGGNGHLKISRDRGLTLQPLKDFSVGGIASAPSSPSTVYAAAIGGTVWRSPDSGETWDSRGSETHSWTALAVHPADPDIVYAVTSGEGVLKSPDGGLTWQSRNQGLPSQMRVTKLATSDRYKTIFAIIDTRGLFASYDDGATWHMLKPSSGWVGIGDLEINEGDQKTLYWADGQLFRSRDLGQTWQEIPVPEGAEVTQAAGYPDDPNHILIYDFTTQKVMRTTNAGATWSAVTTITPDLPDWGNISVSDIVIDPTDTQRIYLGTPNHPWRSTDGGQTWQILEDLEYSVIYNNVLRQTSFIRDIAIDPVDPSILYATTQWGGTWKSTDFGDNWQRMSTPNDLNLIHNNVVFDPRDHQVIYVSALYEGMFRTTNGGTSWTKIKDGLLPSENGTLYRIAISPWDPDHLFGGGYYAGVYRGGGGPYVPTLQEKLSHLPDGAVVELDHELIISGAMPDGARYAQAADRSHGLRLQNASDLNVGDVAMLQGALGTWEAERTLNVAQGLVLRQEESPQPLVVRGSALGWSLDGPSVPAGPVVDGVGNQGLLVSVHGRVTGLDGSRAFYVDDGSLHQQRGAFPGVRVELGAPAVPHVGEFVRVVGESGGRLTAQGSEPVIRTGSEDDVHPRNYLLNGSFETGSASGWSGAGSAGLVLSGPYFGIYGHSGLRFFVQSSALGYGTGTIHQQVQVQPGKSYRARVFSAIYRSQNSVGDVKARIGVDPTGGTDPADAHVVWSPWDTQNSQYVAAWHELQTPPVVSTDGVVTVFLQNHHGTSGFRINAFDDALLREEPAP